MAGVPLTDTQSRANFFQQSISNNLRYWQSWLQTNQADVSAVDRERTNIVRAISYAFNFEPCWPLVLELVQTLSPLMERRGHWESWNWTLTRAVKTAAQFGDVSAEVALSTLLARLLFQQSRPKESIYYYRRAIRLARQMDDHFSEARACTNLGYYFIEQGYWHRAKVLCCHALALFEQLDSNYGRAHTENHLGVLYRVQHRWDQAQQHFERACVIWQEMDDEHGLMRGHLNLSALYINKNEPDSALDTLETALTFAQSTGDEITQGIIFTNIGIAYRLKGQLSQSETYAKQAEEIFKQHSKLAELARVWSGLGLIRFQRDQRDEAHLYLHKALDLWRNLDNKFEQAEILTDIIECNLIWQQWTEAEQNLEAVEQLIGSDSKSGQYRHLWQRLKKCRRDQTNQTLSQAATG